MSSDPPSRTRRFGRKLFSSNKEDIPSPTLKDAPDQKKVKRQSSLFDLFSKPKVERARVYRDPNPIVEKHEELPASTELYTRPERAKRESRLDLNQLIQKPSTTEPPKTSAHSIVAAPQPINAASQQSPIQPHQQDEGWVPVPLFQAFPQSLMHGNLQGVSSSTESLFRARQNKYSSNSFQDTESSTSNGSKRLSVLSETPDLMDKVFVLVTAGRLVQYSGSGNSDRMPEKILQLGPKSAAFACDLVPGRHWVVQVVQSSTDLTVPSVKPSRSILSRIRVPILNRRQVTSLLLIFSSAESMEAWLKTLRSLIQNLGGQIQNPTDPESKTERETEAKVQRRLTSMPSHRYLVQRDPQKFVDNRRDSISPVTSASRIQSPRDVKRLSLAASANSATSGESPTNTPIERQSSGSVRSKRLSSVPTSASLSPNRLHLEPLKETTRFSSTSTRTSRTFDNEIATAATSVCSSSPPSPQDGSNSPQSSSAKSFSSSPNLSGSSRRRSAHFVPSVPPLPQGSVKRLSVVAATPMIDRTSPTNAEFPRLTAENRIPQSKQTLQTPPIPEADSERSSMELPIQDTTSLEVVIDQKSRPISGVGELPSLSRPQSRTDYGPPLPRVRPFARPLPVRAATGGTRDSRARLSGDTSNRDNKENLDKFKSKQSRESAAEEELSPIKHLEKLASELQMDSAMREARTRDILNSGLNHRMSLQSLPLASQNVRSRNSYMVPAAPSMVPGKRTSSGGSTMSSKGIPARRSSIASLSQGYTTLLQPMNQVQVNAQTQAQTTKLRRPTSMQVRTNHAPFLSTRTGRTSSISRQSPTSAVSEIPSGTLPLMAASQSAAPAPFVPYSRQSSNEAPTNTTSQRPSILSREHQRFSIRGSPTTVPQLAPMRAITSSTLMQRPSLPEYLVTPARLTPRVDSSQLEQAKLLSRASSSTLFASANLRPSYSAADLSTIAQRTQPVPANTSAKRLSFVAPQAFNPSQVKPQIGASPPKDSFVARQSAMFNQNAPMPPMKLNRASLRGKFSMPNMGAVGLPPPMPPPMCPLPRVPSGPMWSTVPSQT